MNNRDFFNIELADVQNRSDNRNIPLKKVGIKNIRYPIVVLDKEKGTQRTVASINMYVDLPHNFKGTHMSRFVEILNQYRRQINIRTMEAILTEMKSRLDAQEAHLEVSFPYFIEKKAPVTKSPGLMEYQCAIHGSLSDKLDIMLLVKVPITTVCPCSKEISDYGAHNQRGEVRVKIRFTGFLWLEDVISAIEKSASCDIYSVLKRPDEKYVTEKAFNRPMFVEDVVRATCLEIKKLSGIKWACVEAENFESIHNHSAYAYAEILF